MSASNSLTKGPLPPGVYWRRRIVVLTGAAVLVFVIAHLIGGGSNGSSGGDPVARQAAAPVSSSAGTPSTTAPPTNSAVPTGADPIPTSGTTATTGTASSSPLVLAAPSGSCSPGDIRVTPKVDHAVVDSDITLGFALQTKSEAACTFQVTPHDLAVKIVRHGRVLWTSQQCAKVLPERSVVVRNVVPSLVTMVWDGQISTEGCRRNAGWVRPGEVTIWASTLGGEPGHTDVTLEKPGATSSSSASTTAPVSPKANPTVTRTDSAEPRR